MKVIDVVEINFNHNTIMAVIDDYFSTYSKDPEVPETSPRLCVAKFDGENPSTKNLNWSPIEPDYDV